VTAQSKTLDVFQASLFGNIGYVVVWLRESRSLNLSKLSK